MPEGLHLVDPLPGVLLDEGSLPVRPWADELIDALGVDPRSSYVERFWLGILGPSTTWLLRRVVSGFDRHPAGFPLVLADTARELGLGDKGGRHSPFVRALVRSCQFELARVVDGALEVRRKLPPLNRRQVARLPDAVRLDHEAWQAAQLGPSGASAVRARARALALTLIDLNPDTSAVEQRMTSWDVHPAIAGEATRWAWERHLVAARAAETQPKNVPAGTL